LFWACGPHQRETARGGSGCYEIPAPARTFTDTTGAKYAPGCFLNPTGTGYITTGTFLATDPDDDVVEAEE